MRNVLCALTALLLITVITSAGTNVERASAGHEASITLSEDASVRADGIADPSAFVEPPLTTAGATERPVERVPHTSGSSDRGKQAHAEPLPFYPDFSFSWVPASSSVRRAWLLVYRL